MHPLKGDFDAVPEEGSQQRCAQQVFTFKELASSRIEAGKAWGFYLLTSMTGSNDAWGEPKSHIYFYQTYRSAPSMEGNLIKGAGVISW